MRAGTVVEDDLFEGQDEAADIACRAGFTEGTQPRDLFEGQDEAADIACRAGFTEGTQPRLDVAFRHAVAREDADLLVGGGGGVLEHGVELFVELLAGAHSGDRKSTR